MKSELVSVLREIADNDFKQQFRSEVLNNDYNHSYTFETKDGGNILLAPADATSSAVMLQTM